MFHRPARSAIDVRLPRSAGAGKIGRVPLPSTPSLIRVASAAYLANCVLGTAVAARVVDTSGSRWVHHVLFVGTATLTAAAVVLGLARRAPAAAALAPALLTLAVLPHAGTRRHARVALAAAPWFGAALIATGRG